MILTPENEETHRLKQFRDISDKFIRDILKQDVPWRACAGPSTWEQVYGKAPIPVYVWEVDTRLVSASKLMGAKNLTHDISTALGGIRVHWKNHIGLGLVFDERPEPKFPEKIPLPDPPIANYLLPLGVDLQGQAIWRSIRDTKNIIAAGSTQYGKTSGLRSWLVALIKQHPPDELQLAMVDGKDFEFAAFEGSPYLPEFMQNRVATEPAEVEAVTAALVQEILQRRQIFRTHGVRTPAALQAKTGQRLPVLILIVDEVKDLLDAGLDPTNLFRITQQGIGVDIFVILGTQRPDTRTVQKSNFATLAAYHLANTAESQVIFTIHTPYYTLQNASPGELVVLGPGLDYMHLKSFWAPTLEAMPPLSKLEKILVRVAVLKHEGDCSVHRIYETIKQELPSRYWQEGGPFTHYRLQVTFKTWEQMGLLTKSSKNAAGHNLPRKVTPQLKRLAGL